MANSEIPDIDLSEQGTYEPGNPATAHQNAKDILGWFVKDFNWDNINKEQAEIVKEQWGIEPDKNGKFDSDAKSQLFTNAFQAYIGGSSSKFYRNTEENLSKLTLTNAQLEVIRSRRSNGTSLASVVRDQRFIILHNAFYDQTTPRMTIEFIHEMSHFSSGSYNGTGDPWQNPSPINNAYKFSWGIVNLYEKGTK